MSRSFGTFFLCLTQNLSTAVPDPRLLKSLFTNVRWSLSLRGEPEDCSFLKPRLPVSGRRPKPKQDPFEETRFHSAAEEQNLLWEEIANLPDHHAYFWWRGVLQQAVRIRTCELDIPQGRDLEDATLAFRRDPTLGHRLSQKEYDRLVADRDLKTAPKANGSLDATLERAYRRTRLGGETNRDEA